MCDSVCEAGVDSLSPLVVPETYNYIAAFLTLRCNLHCSYCINRHGDLHRPDTLLSAADWVRGLNRIRTRPDLPVTLQGGEPSLHPGFYDIIDGISSEINIDLLTNLSFDVDEFMNRISPDRLWRNAPYASIRVSYHPETMELDVLQKKVLKMLEKGYSVGIWAVNHPAQSEHIVTAQNECRAKGIDFRIKEFLGNHHDRLYGSYKYMAAISGGSHEQVECRTSELLIDPQGGIQRCHSDLYAGRKPYAVLTDPEFLINDGFMPCSMYGSCNPCDIKIKTNRFQEFGHTSVDIRFPGPGKENE